MLQTSLLLMKSLNKTETPIFLSIVCSLFPKAIFLTFIVLLLVLVSLVVFYECGSFQTSSMQKGFNCMHSSSHILLDNANYFFAEGHVKKKKKKKKIGKTL